MVGCCVVGGRLREGVVASRRRRKFAKMVHLVGTVKKEDDKIKMEEMHQQWVNQMIKSVEGSAGLLAQDHEARSMERRIAVLGERKRGCQAVGPL